MTVLSDRTIRDLIRAVDLVRLPGGSGKESLPGLAVQPVSVDVHLDMVMAHDGGVMVGKEWQSVTPGDGAFLLGSTVEIFKVPDNVVGLVVGKSSVGRAGMMAECAGLVDPGFEGQITLELANLLPMTGLELVRGMRIAQVAFMWVDQPVELPYGSEAAGSHYQGQRGPTPSHLL